MITEVEDYFRRGCGRCARFDTSDCSTRLWAEELSALRRICLDMGLEETVRWGHPCYRHAGRSVALIGALRGDLRLSLFDAALLADAGGLLERNGPNSQHADTIKLRDNAAVAAAEPAIRALLGQAMSVAVAGLRPPRRVPEVELPEALVAALDVDPELAEAFHALTPGRQRSHVIALSQARTVATQQARLARLRPAILAGRGAQER